MALIGVGVARGPILEYATRKLQRPYSHSPAAAGPIPHTVKMGSFAIGCHRGHSWSRRSKSRPPSSAKEDDTLPSALMPWT